MSNMTEEMHFNHWYVSAGYSIKHGKHHSPNVLPFGCFLEGTLIRLSTGEEIT